jgi:hypothetical protein
MGTATAGPVFSYSSESGVGYGWSANGGFGELNGSPNPSGGPTLTLGIGQSWRHGGKVVSPAASAPRNDGRVFELLTYFDLGLKATYVESLPSYTQFGISVGPAWSSSSEDDRAGLVLEMSPSAAFVPGQYTWPGCGGTTNVGAPTFVMIVGMRYLYGSAEFYASPQIGFVSEQLSGEWFCH